MFYTFFRQNRGGFYTFFRLFGAGLAIFRKTILSYILQCVVWEISHEFLSD